MIMAVLCAVPFSLAANIYRRTFFYRKKFRATSAKLLRKNKKPTRLRVGWNFSFTALITNSPLAPYLGGTQNRNQYA
jgi:hypothetical protein